MSGESVARVGSCDRKRGDHVFSTRARCGGGSEATLDLQLQRVLRVGPARESAIALIEEKV